MAPSVRSMSRLTPLASRVASVFLLSAPLTLAASTWTVNTCDEGTSGDLGTRTGTLRFAVANANAAGGDVIDMTNLSVTCSTISLSTGAIAVTESGLTINGPGSEALTITRAAGGTQDRIFTHTGTGTLSITNLSITSGYLFPAGDASGGCIYSKGNVSLDHVRVSSCKAASVDSVKGGGIFTAGNLTMNSSTLDGNTGNSGVFATYAEGGGAEVLGNFIANYSTISNNQIIATVPTIGFGGGLRLFGDATITQSTISGNSSSLSDGGIAAIASRTRNVVIKDSTISGNHAINGFVGGIISDAVGFTLANSTVVFNTAKNDFSSPNNFSPGLTLLADTGNILAQLKSSLLANNSYGASNTQDDLSTARYGYSVTFAPSGTNPAFHNNNLIRANRDGVVPQNTIAGVCPLLAPLSDNGGTTKTHALLTGSPGIDAGSNVFNLVDDQRGLTYVRVSNGVADVGAYELQQNDVIFNSGFEGCP